MSLSSPLALLVLQLLWLFFARLLISWNHKSVFSIPIFSPLKSAFSLTVPTPFHWFHVFLTGIINRPRHIIHHYPQPHHHSSFFHTRLSLPQILPTIDSWTLWPVFDFLCSPDSALSSWFRHFFSFLVICGRLSWLPIGFECTDLYSRIASYRTIP